MNTFLLHWSRLGAALALAGAFGAEARAQTAPVVGDYIVAVVNQELVTAVEVERRMRRAQLDAARAGARLPPEATLRQQVLDALIEERVIITHARDSGMSVDEVELDRAVHSVAAQNQISVDELRQRLREEGQDYARFRANLRDQILMERVREREVYQRISVEPAEIDGFVEQQRRSMQAEAELNLAHILLPVPEGADAATVAQVRVRAESVLDRVRDGADFATLAREISADGNREGGGEIGLRAVSRLPDVFVGAVRGVPSGGLAPELVRTGAGFHVLKVIERKDGGELRSTQTRARHILLRTSPQLSAEVAAQRLAEYRRQIESGQRSFEELAREFSEDGSAARGGDLGWAGPGSFVPEFDEAMNKLAVGGLSQPVASRFGVHLIQVLERRQVAVDPKEIREQARGVLREKKFGQAYTDWARELRDLAYVEMREPPQ